MSPFCRLTTRSGDEIDADPASTLSAQKQHPAAVMIRVAAQQLCIMMTVVKPAGVTPLKNRKRRVNHSVVVVVGCAITKHETFNHQLLVLYSWYI